MAKPNWIEKLKMGATKVIKEKYHSPAGREHLKTEKKRKEGEKKTKAKQKVTSYNYYGGANKRRKTADELLKEIKGY